MARLFVISVATMLFIALAGGCGYIFAPQFLDLNTSIPEYPNARNVETTVEENGEMQLESTISFETNDPPSEVYDFYRSAFRWRLNWTQAELSDGDGLLFVSRSCPISQHAIFATPAENGMTGVEILFSQGPCR